MSFENDYENESGSKKKNRNKRSQLLVETASIGARALMNGFLSGAGFKLGSTLVERATSSRKQRVSVAELRRNG